MKKLLFLALLSASLCITSFAQTDKKVKPTSDVPEKVHNVLSKHKEHNGYKVKTETNGVKHKKKVNTKTGEVKVKTTT